MLNKYTTRRAAKQISLETKSHQKSSGGSSCKFYEPDDSGKGGSASGTPGLALTYRGIYFYTIVSAGDKLWNLTVPGPVPNNTWSEIGIRWKMDTGLEMFVNAVLKGIVLYPENKAAKDPLSPLELTVGCHRNADGEYENFAYGEFDELTGWLWAFNNDEEAFFLGGYDKSRTCDPETHPLHCETNPEKIFKMMESMKLEDTSSLLSVLDHMKAITEVAKDPEGSDDLDIGNKNANDLAVFVEIMTKMVRMTMDSPSDLKVEELEKLMVMQNIFSNLLDEKYVDGWQKLQDEKGISSVEFVKLMENWIMTKTMQTDNGKETIGVDTSCTNIVSKVQKMTLYGFLEEGSSFSFPAKENNKRKKRQADDSETVTDSEGLEEEKEDYQPIVQLATTMYGVQPKDEKVTFQGSSYKNLDKIAPLWNKKSGTDGSLYFLDSEVISVSCNPEASSTALESDPNLVILKHRRKVKASGRKLLANADLRENGEVRNRECTRWDSNLEMEKTDRKGGWSSDGCSTHNSSEDATTCTCQQMGMYAVLAKIRQPFDIPPEDEWLTICKWIGFGLSAIMLLLYIIVITFRMALHELFHLIRLNLAGAALGAMISFFLSGFLHGDEDICRIISMLIHFFYTAVGTWLTVEAFALFSALVNGVFASHSTCYIITGWIIPGGMIGGCITLFPNYGYDYRCLVGPTATRRWLLVMPILIGGMSAFTFSLLTCINYGTPAVKKTAIVNELSTATRSSFIVIILFLITWVCGVFALVDLGFDGGEIPAFNPVFQILNSCLGIFIVLLIGFGSKHFRYCLCHSSKSALSGKNRIYDPFDIHDRTAVNTKKKIYAA